MSTVVCPGLGNIGSQTVQLLAREPRVTRIVAVDPDSYSPGNLVTQNVDREDVGGEKAVVQARRLRRARLELEVEPIVARVQDVPLGRLRGDVIVAGLDSREARRAVNQIAWRLGVPWCDAGVAPDGLLARVNVHVPGIEAPCLECAWTPRDYDALEQDYSCVAGQRGAPPSGSPAALGALAAALIALEATRLLAGRSDEAAVGKQVVIDARTHRLVVSSLRRNPRCRFDHATLSIQRLTETPDALTVGACLALAGRDARAIVVEGRPFVRDLVCASCASQRAVLGLFDRLKPAALVCDRCGGPAQPLGFTASETLEGEGSVRDVSLASLGFRSGDVLGLEAPGRTSFVELG